MNDIKIAKELLSVAKRYIREDIQWHEVVAYIANDLHYTQEEIGEYCGVTRQCVQQWQKGAFLPSTDKQDLLIEMLEEKGISIDIFQPITDDSLKELIDIFKKLPAEKQAELLKFAKTKEMESWCPII